MTWPIPRVHFVVAATADAAERLRTWFLLDGRAVPGHDERARPSWLAGGRARASRVRGSAHHSRQRCATGSRSACQQNVGTPDRRYPPQVPVRLHGSRPFKRLADGSSNPPAGRAVRASQSLILPGSGASKRERIGTCAAQPGRLRLSGPSSRRSLHQAKDNRAPFPSAARWRSSARSTVPS